MCVSNTSKNDQTGKKALHGTKVVHTDADTLGTVGAEVYGGTTGTISEAAITARSARRFDMHESISLWMPIF